MLKELKKKNSQYSQKERVCYALLSTVLIFIFSYLVAGSLTESVILQYIAAFLVGIFGGLLGFRCPKAVYIFVLALPLSLVGN
ncbi:hypothetical protein [Microbulbifer sp. SSSA005]|uniref:hypothetical protein n=1 Tax=unclassified Microbulbifer TaxID=2619833 RepID=UPI004039263B